MERQRAAASKQIDGVLRSALVRAHRANLATWTPAAVLTVLALLAALRAAAYVFAARTFCRPPPPDKAVSLRVAYETAPRTFALVFSTGRAGTLLMSQLLESPDAHVTHQDEAFNMRTCEYVERYYRRLASAESEAKFNASARAFVVDEKIPFYHSLLAAHGKKRFVYTGHLPLVFGLGPSFLDALPRGTLRILRLRRDRIATALSLMALGPEEEDPWSISEPGMHNRRWFPEPSSAMVRLGVDIEIFLRDMNRFQRWLWYVDDVECRWQALVADRGHDFEWIEESLESLEAMDGGRGWARVAAFLGVGVRGDRIGARHNSIQSKSRVKLDVSETKLRQWEVDYRNMVGSCNAGSVSYSWNHEELL
jgi:hypothetical protein